MRVLAVEIFVTGSKHAKVFSLLKRVITWLSIFENLNFISQQALQQAIIFKLTGLNRYRKSCTRIIVKCIILMKLLVGTLI